MTKTGYDSVAASASEWRRLVPTPTPQVIGCYGNGRFANHTAAQDAFPQALIVVYDVNASMPECDLLDIEPFDAVPAQAPGWARRNLQLHRTRVLSGPGLYESASSISAVVSAMLDAGFKRNQFLINSAHFTFVAHICGPHTCGFAQADCTQYADKGLRGQNTDLTLWDDHCFAHAAPPPDPDANYKLFDNRRRGLVGGRTEQGIVREYDRWRATQTATRHPHRARLKLLRGLLWLLSKRLRALPASPANHRAWRIRELQDRAAGKRLV